MTKQKFINQWLSHFAKNIEKDKISKYVKDQFIWHIFSFEIIDRDCFLSGDAARHAYDEADKSDCIFCDMFGPNGVSHRMSEEYRSAASIDQIDRSLTELYVVSKDYSWTYIKTHENDLCGPYFMKIKQ